MNEDQPLKTFIIYARDDKEYKNQLLRHLKPLVKNHYLQVWHDGDILPGEDWKKEIKGNLLASELVLVLVSVNCLNSDFIEDEELEMAVQRLNQGNTRIVPIIVSPCVWQIHSIFKGLQGLPEDMKPVSNWPNPDQAWTNVAESLMSIVDESRAKKEQQAKIQRDLEERQRLEALAAERENLLKAERVEEERIAQEQRMREAAEQKRLEEEHQKQLALEVAQRAEAERLQREKQAEWNRQHDEAWRAAQAANSIEALEDFCNRYPHSHHFRQAKQQIKAIRQQNSVSGQTRAIIASEILQAIADGKLEQAFVLAKGYVQAEAPGLKSDLVTLENNYNLCKGEYLKNKISFEEFSRHSARASDALCQMFAPAAETGPSPNQRLIFGGLGVLLAIFIGVWWIRSCNDQKVVTNPPPKKEDPVKKEMDAWSQAEKTDTYTAYKSYLTDYREGAHAPIARIRLNNFKDSTKVYLQDAERLIRYQKHQKAEPMLRKILEKFDPDNVQAKKLLLR